MREVTRTRQPASTHHLGSADSSNWPLCRRSEIFRREACASSDAGQHLRANLYAVVEGEDHIRPTIARQYLMRATELTLDRPPDTKKRGQNAPRLGGRPRSHFELLGSAKRDAYEVRTRLTMVEAVSEIAKRQGLCAGKSFIARLPIGQNARKVGDLGDPASIVLAFQVDSEVHGSSCGHGLNLARTPCPA